MSHPTWVRGLKPDTKIVSISINVAPYVGAWIETDIDLTFISTRSVAPYVGAWIETQTSAYLLASHLCRTLRGCVD